MDKIKFTVSIISICILIWLIYKAYLSPITSFKEYVRRIDNFEFVFLRNKANKLRIKALNVLNLENTERYRFLVETGLFFYKQKNINESKVYLDMAVDNLLNGEKFYFHSALVDIIKFYAEIGEKRKAVELYNNFLERKNFDNRFNELRSLFELINS